MAFFLTLQVLTLHLPLPRTMPSYRMFAHACVVITPHVDVQCAAWLMKPNSLLRTCVTSLATLLALPFQTVFYTHMILVVIQET